MCLKVTFCYSPTTCFLPSLFLFREKQLHSSNCTNQNFLELSLAVTFTSHTISNLWVIYVGAIFKMYPKFTHFLPPSLPQLRSKPLSISPLVYHNSLCFCLCLSLVFIQPVARKEMFKSNSYNPIFLHSLLLCSYFSQAKSQNFHNDIQGPTLPVLFLTLWLPAVYSLPPSFSLSTLVSQLFLSYTKTAPVTGPLHFLFPLLGKLPFPPATHTYTHGSLLTSFT